MKLDKLAAWIERAAENGAVPVLTGNGDMDTIGSAIALASSTLTSWHVAYILGN